MRADRPARLHLSARFGILVLSLSAGSAACVETDVAEPAAVETAAQAVNLGNIDLSVDAEALASSLLVRTRNFKASDCAIEEACIGGPGRRRLLTFDTVTANHGPDDLFLGDPTQDPQGLFEFSSCHGHYHFNGYADYRLVGSNGVVARGHKQAFCLLDSMAYDESAGPSHGYNCGFQGLTAGWADVYTRNLDCQWIDITGVPDGSYTLEVELNPDGVIDETILDNNLAQVAVTIAGGNVCAGAPSGSACTANSDCCSGSCRVRHGTGTCR